MLDVQHPTPWGWKVSSYFLTKGVAAGAMMLAAILTVAPLLAGLLALGGIAATGAFLVADLKQPKRFYFLFTRPQWRSWLALGAQVINLAGLIAFLFTLAAVLGLDGVREVLGWAMVPAGVLLAAYTALLFRQCEGRDLWQSPWLIPHTIVNAVVAGAGALGIATLFGAEGGDALRWVLVGSCLLSIAMIAFDTWGHHATDQARRAALNLWRDRFGRRFFAGLAGLVLAGLLPLAGAGAGLLTVAGVLALVGLWLYEDAWVRAGQSVPLS
jgi:formate-dependent nitrite reductase membrane component NrfD